MSQKRKRLCGLLDAVETVGHGAGKWGSRLRARSAERFDAAEAKRIGEEAAAKVLSNDLIEGFEVIVG